MVGSEPMIGLHTGIDAKGVFEALNSRDMGKISDKSMIIYVMAYRQAVREKLVEVLGWMPTESMMADALTKFMDPGEIWAYFYRYAWWTPQLLSHLPEDLVLYDTNTGQSQRWRMVEPAQQDS